MATVLTNTLLLVDGANLSGQTNKASIAAEFDELDATTFGSNGWKEVAAGLGSSTWAAEGLWAAGDLGKPDDRLWADLGGTAAWTIAASPTDGDVAYLGSVMSAQFKVGGQVGELAPFTADGKGSGRAVRGQTLHPVGTARTTSGTGAAQQLGAVPAGKVMLAALHVCSVAGTTPSLTVKLRSSATSGGSYTDRATFTAANAIGSQVALAAAAVTDTWWRVEWAISGSTPSFLFTVAAGVGPA